MVEDEAEDADEEDTGALGRSATEDPDFDTADIIPDLRLARCAVELPTACIPSTDAARPDRLA